MAQTIVTETNFSRSQLLVVGNHDQIGKKLAFYLSSLDSQVYLYLQTQKSCSQKPNSTLKFLSSLTEAPNPSTTDHIFFIEDYTHHSQNNLVNILNTYYQSKITYISQPPKAESTQTPLFLQQHQLLVNAVTQNKIDTRVVHLNYLFGPGVISTDCSSLGKFFTYVITQYCLPLNSEDIQIYPLFINTALEGILSAAFTSDSKGKIYELAGNPISLLNFSKKIRKLLGQQSFQFTSTPLLAQPNTELVAQIRLTHKELNFFPPHNLDQQLTETLTWFRSHLSEINRSHSHSPNSITNFTPSQIIKSPKSFSLNPKATLPSKPQTKLQTDSKAIIIDSPHINTLQNTSAKNSPKFKNKRFFKNLLILIIIILTPPVLFILLLSKNLYLIKLHTNQVQHSLTNGNFTQASNYSKKIQSHLTSIQPQLKLLLTLPLIHSDLHLKPLQHFLEISQSLAQTAIDINETNNSFTRFSAHFFGHQRYNPPKDIKDTQTYLSQTYHDLSQLEALLNRLSNSTHNTTFLVGEWLEPLAAYVSQTKKPVYSAHQLFDQAPSLFGFDSPQTYLVLIQDSGELRPTGGIVNSYALASLQNGQLVNFNVQPTYLADSLLKGHVEPPPSLKKHLGETNWYLRDSNWDPDFTTTAQRAAWFIDKELETSPDGVISIDLETIKAILNQTGPITLSEPYGTIDSNNFFSKIIFLQQQSTRPEKKQPDQLTIFFQKFFDHLFQVNSSNQITLIKQLFSLADQKQLSFFFKNRALHEVVDRLGWSGKVVNPNCHLYVKSKSCLTDYLGIFEANVGANKSNLFLTRKIDQHTTILPTLEIKKEVILTHHNSSPNQWPGGTYQSYIRVYTPANSTLSHITINNQRVNPQDIDITIEHNKTVFGFLLIVEPETTTSSKIYYSLSEKLPSTSPTAYSLYFQKQPGLPTEPLSLTLSSPQSLTLISTNPSSRLYKAEKNTRLEANTSTDQILSFEFAR